MNNVFKTIPNFPNYEINETGEIRSLSRSGVRTDGKTFDVSVKTLKPYLKKGKPYIQLHKDGKKVCKSIATLIKDTFNVESGN